MRKTQQWIVRVVEPHPNIGKAVLFIFKAKDDTELGSIVMDYQAFCDFYRTCQKHVEKFGLLPENPNAQVIKTGELGEEK